ncbi:RDD family protein [Streptomyces sp. NPDC048483]|uniref:RDD family protein n=1 Tax=Streptomyces sp. NPDC048483 TaxID=3154927 RepID=UPI003428839F
MYEQSFPQQPNNQQPQHPYQQQPYQQGPPPPQQYGQQYGQPQGQPYQQQPQHPYQQQPYQQGPPPPHLTAVAPRIPEPANDMRRIGAVTLDGLLTLTVIFGGFRALSGSDLPFLKELLIVVGSGLGFAFLNHVILARISGASIGKFAARTRVIYEKTGTRPGLPRLFRRWLGGYLYIAIWLIAALMDSADEGPDDFCGVRLVRYRDLRAAAQMQGR